MRAAEPTGADDATKVLVVDTQSHRADAGMAWGTLIHGLLEHAIRHKDASREDLRRLVMWLTVEEPQLRAASDSALDTAEAVAGAQFWQDARASDRSVETPFTFGEVERLTNGVIDLIHHGSGVRGFTDYKTDMDSWGTGGRLRRTDGSLPSRVRSVRSHCRDRRAEDRAYGSKGVRRSETAMMTTILKNEAGDEPSETVIEVLAEGGSVSISARHLPTGGYEYRVVNNEAALWDLLDEPTAREPVSSATPVERFNWLSSWDQALSVFDKYPWCRFHPASIHPEFASRVARALSLRGVDPTRDASWRHALEKAGWTTMRRAGDRDPVMSDRHDRALILSAVAHASQDRKGTKIPYSTHPVHVARLLERMGLDENVVIAGLLHDVMEDLKPEDAAVRSRFRDVYPPPDRWPDDADAFKVRLRQLINAEFGAGVVNLVEAVSEQKAEGGIQRPWKVRKLEQLQHLTSATPAVAVLKCADALHNADSIVRDMTERTPDAALSVLTRFKACPDDLLWYYGSVAALSSERVLDEHLHLVRELEETVRTLEQEVDRACGDRDSFTGERPRFVGHASDAIGLLSRSGRRIYSFDQWRRFAPPARGDAQWKDLRSAKELARAWFSGLEPRVPRECLDLLNSSLETEGITIRTIFAERHTVLDAHGPGRQHDLLAHGTFGTKRVVIAVEAKADESFGPAIGEYLSQIEVKNEARRRDGHRLSAVPERIEELSQRVFGRSIDAVVRATRYQLLHATAGTTIEAENADTAVLIVHEFISSACDKRRLEMNWSDLVQFSQLLDGASALTRAGRIAGPYKFGDPAGVPLYVGKACRTLPIGVASR
jgi:uncharacterized protein DUF6946/HD domain-containing protein/PD-(D/E)XK nuclease superfamily protein